MFFDTSSRRRSIAVSVVQSRVQRAIVILWESRRRGRSFHFGVTKLRLLYVGRSDFSVERVEHPCKRVTNDTIFRSFPTREVGRECLNKTLVNTRW